MNDNQMIKENWFEAMTRQSIEQFDKLTIRRPVVKHIPVTHYSEVKPTDRVDDWEGKALVLTNIGGKLYKKTII